MPESEMVQEVKALLKEGYSLDKIRSNLVKIGYNDKEAEAIITEAKAASAKAGEEEAFPETRGGIEYAAPQSEDDMLLAQAGEEEEPVPAPVTNAPTTSPQAAPTNPRHRHGPAARQEPAEAKAAQAEGMTLTQGQRPGADEPPSPGSGKAMVILALAFLAVLALAYFILFPKLGIKLL